MLATKFRAARRSLGRGWPSQAADNNGFDIINTYIAEVAVDHLEEEGDAKTYGLRTTGSQLLLYFKVPPRG
jgi:hypothetical protein